MTAVKMPQLGETVIEGTILKWLKQEGDQVALDEPLFEISTDKVDTEVPSSAAGTLTKILVAEGETVAVGTELAEISDGGAGRRRAFGGCGAARFGWLLASRDHVHTRRGRRCPLRPDPARWRAGSPARRRLCGRDAPRWRLRRRPRCPDRGPRSQILSPLVRKLANEHGVDLVAGVRGRGPGGGSRRTTCWGSWPRRGRRHR